EQERTAAEKFWAAGHKPGDVGRDNDAFIDQHLALLPNGQTSLVVEPADGQAPFRTDALQPRDSDRDMESLTEQHMALMPTGQPSLVVEPADGKVPFRPEALQRRDFNL